MSIRFTVGESERHDVEFSFDKFLGRLRIRVDGKSVVDEVRFASLSTVKRYEFLVGQAEQHRVTIEKERRALLAGFRPQVCRAFVDGAQVAEGRL